MIDKAEIVKVLEAIASEDPGHEDEQLEAMNDALRFALGDGEATAEEFINMYVRGE